MGKMKQFYYVWQLSEQEGVIEVACLKCEYKGRVMAKGFPAKIQEKPVSQLKFKCTRCGSKETVINRSF